MFLLAGLGNPGARYAGNRHNIGFMAAEAIAARWKFPAFSQKSGALIAQGEIAGQRALLVKPQSFMNDSGQPVGEIMRFYKLPPEQLIVLHDELDLPLGEVRVKNGGGNAGHNGLKSIDAHISPHYWRVRIGVGHPGISDLVTQHVLSDFGKDEIEIVDKMLEGLSKYTELLLQENKSEFVSKLKAFIWGD